ncbi:FMN-binding negative transcriptional regulator [Deinococcus roseus]|uniref:Transcriptional regulator n=1 Tax=Deinococcus roseus TaxID=392414 RepID=A0ABQ2DAU3_9DEIO|nr:FMN-binding negative transcriptional regulator [Deinococcus roseus]GGJ51980.1 hypothetical protein GCM10008938_42490 [Deinococcus roseus]
MYRPPYFKQDDPTELHRFMQAHSFSTLVSQQPFMATHLPLLIEEGRISGHVARANQHSKLDGQEVLVMFQGPHAYVSAGWYQQTGEVPTWNYTAVHAYGTFHPVTDPQRVSGHLRQLVTHHEQHQPTPWELDLSEEALQKMARAILVFDIHITRLEGKYKLSQNRTPLERERVVEGLQRKDGKVADLVKKWSP